MEGPGQPPALRWALPRGHLSAAPSERRVRCGAWAAVPVEAMAPELVWPVSSAPSWLIWLQRAPAPSHAHKHAPCEPLGPGGAPCTPKTCAPLALPPLHLLLSAIPKPSSLHPWVPCAGEVQGGTVERSCWTMAMVVGTDGDFSGAPRRQLRCGSAAWDGAAETPGHPAGILAEPRLFVEPPQAPKAQTWLRGERVSSAHAKQRRRDWLGKLPGRARAAAPRLPQTASPTPCRGARHPCGTQGCTRLPGRMLQGNGPPGPPNKVRAGRSRTHRRGCPRCRSPGNTGGTHPATSPHAPSGKGQRRCWIQQLPALGQLWPRGFFSSSLRASVSPAWLLAHVRRGQAPWCCVGHSLLETPMAPAATGFPGDPVLGNRHLVLRGWERTTRAQELGSPWGCGSVTPQRKGYGCL